MSRDARLRVVVLISGEGTNLQALIDAAGKRDARFVVAAVLSDRGDAPGLDRARRAGIATGCVDRRFFDGREAFDRALGAAADAHAPGLVVLAGFMRILGPAFVQHFAGRMVNIHPSLLPKYKGLHTHRRALEAAESEHGATVHFVTPELDGGPCIIQYRTAIRKNDTEETLSARVHEGEYMILPQAVAWFAEGRLRMDETGVTLDEELLANPVKIEER